MPADVCPVTRGRCATLARCTDDGCQAQRDLRPMQESRLTQAEQYALAMAEKRAAAQSVRRSQPGSAMQKKQRDQRAILRAAWRAASAQIWRQTNGVVRQRTAMEIAAFILDNSAEPDIADWLLCSAPRYARAVATGVAVHALRRCIPAAWDALAAVDAMNFDQASEWFDDPADFVWSPEPTHLIVEPEKAGPR